MMPKIFLVLGATGTLGQHVPRFGLLRSPAPTGATSIAILVMLAIVNLGKVIYPQQAVQAVAAWCL